MVTWEQALACAPLLPADAALQSLPAVTLSAAQGAVLRQGQAVRGEAVAPAGSRRVRVYGPDGVFMGLAEPLPDGRLQPRRLMLPDAL
jgi:tRNA pseudouridine55 synthase